MMDALSFHKAAYPNPKFPSETAITITVHSRITFALLSLSALFASALARTRGSFRSYDEDEIIPQRSKVTVFVNSEDSISVECWELTTSRARIQGDIGVCWGLTDGLVDVANWWLKTSVDLMGPGGPLHAIGPKPSSGKAADEPTMPMMHIIDIQFGLLLAKVVNTTNPGLHDSLVVIEEHVFADSNGDDWLGGMDTTFIEGSQCGNAGAATSISNRLKVETVSGSASEVFHFEYEVVPHNVLHKGACKFAGFEPASAGKDDYASETRLKTQL